MILKQTTKHLSYGEAILPLALGSHPIGRSQNLLLLLIPINILISLSSNRTKLSFVLKNQKSKVISN